MSKDTLGDRMKDFYEDRTRISLSRRNYTLIRILTQRIYKAYVRQQQRNAKFITNNNI